MTRRRALALPPGAPWSVEVDGDALGFDVFAGPRPADALRRFTARVGRQPPAAAPFYFGPWWQPHGDEAANLAQLRAAGAAGSLVQTYTHYLPCGDQETAARARAHRPLPRRRPRGHHLLQPDGLHVLHRALRSRRGRRRAHQGRARQSVPVPLHGLDELPRRPVRLHLRRRPAAVRRRARRGRAGRLRRLDGGLRRVHARRRARGRRLDGRGRPQRLRPRTTTPPRAPTPATGRGARSRASTAVAGRARRSTPRSCGAGIRPRASASTACAPRVRNGLSMGLSGVSLWGSDIGGFFALSQPQTTPELLQRWIEVGFASGIMRMQANGFSLRPSTRAQIFDADVLPTWRATPGCARSCTRTWPRPSASTTARACR